MEFYALQLVSIPNQVYLTKTQTVMKVLLAHRTEDNPVAASPHFAAIIIGSLVWVFYAWASRLVKGKTVNHRADFCLISPMV